MTTSKIELVEQPVQQVLSIRRRTTVKELPDLIGVSYMKILEYLKELKEEPVGVPFVAYYNLYMEDLDVEMGFPVAKKLPEKDDIKAEEIPGGRVVSTMYKGPYAGMEQPYKDMAQWIAEKRYEPTGVAYEYYYNSPEDVPEKDLLTKIAMPLKE